MLIVRLIWHIFYAQLSKKYLFTFTPQRYNIFSTYANNCLKKATETPAARASSILLCDFISLPFHFIHLHLPGDVSAGKRRALDWWRGIQSVHTVV